MYYGFLIRMADVRVVSTPDLMLWCVCVCLCFDGDGGKRLSDWFLMMQDNLHFRQQFWDK